MVSMWYKLVDKFTPDTIQLIFSDTDSLVFELTGDTYEKADIFSYIRKEPEFAKLFDLTDIPDVPKVGNSDNKYWSLINKKVIVKFKFEAI